MKRLMFLIIIFIAAEVILISCRTQYIPVETVKTEYKVRDSIRHDSIYQHDSVFMAMKGDTVYLYKYKYLYKYQYVNKTDTLIRADSIQIPYPVEKQLSKWQQVKQDYGGTAMLIAILLFLFIVGRLIRRWKI